MLKNASVLIVDDEEIMREILRTLLEHEGCLVSTVETGEEGVALARTQFFDTALVDIMMPGIDGIETLGELVKLDPDLPVVLITAAPSVEKIVTAMQLGAFNFFEKPFDNKKVLAVVRNAVERRRLTAENLALRETLREQTHQFASIIGRSSRMRQVFALISQAAPSRATVLVEGESGTGKELVARALHARSRRAEGPFVTVNSGSLPPDLLESNLFGHVKGA
ncbi:MAG: response regulator, partial [Acidimicrobiales bacterium]|nr:response regulator [Acidimicrobiales bacterium]